jgi:hypothetical protein
MDEALLRADCARCAALCCVTLAFDRSALFAVDKAAGEPCRHLTPHDRCAIHAERTRRGFAGCAAYDCLGAGQRVTQLFAGRSWRDHPSLARAMFDAFTTLRDVHEQLLLLRTAARLPLTRAQSHRRHALETRLDPRRGWTPATLSALDTRALAVEVATFLRTLRPLRLQLRRLPLIP